MIKIIMGKKGMGKTKIIVDLANEAVKQESGCIIFIERGNKLTYDISHQIRLVDSKEYSVESFEKVLWVSLRDGRCQL